MKKIKFRAWSRKTKTMLDLHKITPLVLNAEIDGLFIPFSNDLILMQYTGLKDKNGTEIYEGDLLEMPTLGINEVVFGDFCIGTDDWQVEHKTIGFVIKWKDDSGYTGLSAEDTKDYKVIGNIHQHPDLLKTKTPPN
ncbi:MAG: hypothetical protein IMF11_20215 [Proteobacteria bacterium]|nr:hypothetical protein [Pseudomonadota bacterium]